MYENWYSMEKQMQAARNDFQREAEQNRLIAEALSGKKQAHNQAEAANGFFGQVRRLLHVPGF